MADILSQNEIDDLLNSNLGGDLSDSSSSEEGEDIVPVSTGRQKVFKPPRKDNSGFKFEYRSPVIKREQIIFNPNTPIESSKEKVVVRTLPNYSEYLRKKKTSLV